jgi:hypothetical protein
MGQQTLQLDFLDCRSAPALGSPGAIRVAGALVLGAVLA